MSTAALVRTLPPRPVPPPPPAVCRWCGRLVSRHKRQRSVYVVRVGWLHQRCAAKLAREREGAPC